MIEFQEKVIMYISRVLHPEEKKWSTREKEALGILWAVHTFKPFLIGCRFIIQTDHHSLQWSMTATKPARLVRWAMELSEYDFEIKHRSGKANGNADALSRLPLEGIECIDSISKIELILNTTKPIMDNLDLAKLHTAQRKDPAMQSLIEFLETKSENDPKAQYKLISGVLHEHKKDGSLVLLVPYTMITDVLSLFHDGSTTVHMASDRMYALMRKRFSWSNMHAYILAYVQACLICNKFKKPLQNKNGLLIPIITRKPMEMIAMDIISMHETENNNKHVLVCVDLFTSWVKATPLKSLEAE